MALPAAEATGRLVPRSEKDPDGKWESIHVDGQVFRRRLPSLAQEEFMQATVAAPGARDVGKRLADLNAEGIWSELVFPSLGMWAGSFRTPELMQATMRASNDWAKETIMDHSSAADTHRTGLDAEHR